METRSTPIAPMHWSWSPRSSRATSEMKAYKTHSRSQTVAPTRVAPSAWRQYAAPSSEIEQGRKPHNLDIPRLWEASSRAAAWSKSGACGSTDSSDGRNSCCHCSPVVAAGKADGNSARAAQCDSRRASSAETGASRATESRACRADSARAGPVLCVLRLLDSGDAGRTPVDDLRARCDAHRRTCVARRGRPAHGGSSWTDAWRKGQAAQT